jgi:glycine/D-amino acid oxidase-like deaminating enzyme
MKWSRRAAQVAAIAATLPTGTVAAIDVEERSLWLDSALRDEPARPPLEGDTEADVAILGAGVTGLAAACELRARFPERRVVVLERDRVGAGATGRSTGALTPLPERRWGDKLARDGVEETRRAAAFQAAGVRAAVDLVRGGGIDCGLGEPGYLLLGERRHDPLLRREASAMEQLGLPGGYVDPEALYERLRHEHWHAAVESPSRWLDPARYALGLARLAEQRGAELFERSPVQGLERAEPLERSPVDPRGHGSVTTLRLAGGARVRAPSVVLAVDAAGGRLGLLRSRQYVLHTFAVATEPLPAGRLAALGWRGREILFEAPRSGHTLMLTPDDRLLCRGLVRYRFGDSIEPPPLTSAARALTRAIRERFPQVGDVRISHRWSGPLGMTRWFHPAIGRLPGPGLLLYATGYSGHGLAFGTLAGRLLAELYAGERSPELNYALRFSRPPRLPPEPLRFVGVRAATAWMRLRKL